MHVLENALGIPPRNDVQVAPHLLTPDVRQLLHARSAFHQVLLDLEPQHDVEVIRQLVSFDADQRWFHPVDRGIELLHRYVGQLLREELLQVRIETPPEGAGSPDAVFPES